MATSSGAGPRFYVERAQFDRDFVPYYEQWFTPAILYQFAIYLPFHIPLEDGRVVSIPLNEGAASFVFTTVVTNSQLLADPGAISDEVVTVDVQRTRVEMLYVTDSAIDVDDADLVEMFDRLLDHLNAIVIAYLVLHHDARAYRVSPQSLQAVCLMRRVDLRDWSCDPQLLGLHYDVPYENDTLSDAQIAELGWYALVIESEYNPFITAAELRHAATRELRDGFFRDAVIHAQSAVESMLGSLYVAIREIEGVAVADAEQERENLPFMRMVKREFASRLGGQWNVDDVSTPIGRWRSMAYQLRNKVVHAAYHPCYAETLDAIEAVREFISFITDRMRSQTGTYEPLKRFVSPPMPPADAIRRGAFRQ